jgi:hypothetical protein
MILLTKLRQNGRGSSISVTLQGTTQRSGVASNSGNGAGFEMKIPHIIPPNLGYENMQHIFRQPGQGMALLSPSGNGIPMFFCLEGAFNEGRRTLIGHQRSGCNPIEYSVLVLDGSMLNEPAGYGKRTSDINHKD